ncbi:MAG: M24 family metallopeptidase [Bacteroidales bacterium]|nr:MAG: M24 family metallopeptidase [Bacteroidales bacterium]
MKTLLALSLLFFLILPVRSQGYPPIFSLEKQTELYNKNLEWKLDNILPAIMQREGIDMWVVICFEYSEDPVYRTLTTWPGDGARRLSILIFHDDKDEFKKLSATWHGPYASGHMYEGIFNDRSGGAEGQFKAVADYIRKADPQKIGINYDNSVIDDFSHANGLSHFHYEKLYNALDEKYRNRLVSAKEIVIGWFETRTPWEVSLYRTLCRISHELIREFFSTKVIVPDVTTAAEVRWWICERIRGMNLDYWFFPSLDIIRSPENRDKYGRDSVIRRGDILHCDVGIRYMGLTTDMQHIAYVCRLDEDDAPQGLKALYAEGLRFQEIILEEMVAGRTGNDILRNVLERGRAENIMPRMYSHPVNYFGHGSGVTIGRTDNQEFLPGTGDRPLHANTTYAIEFNVSDEIPEWDNQRIRMGLEDNMIFNGDKAELIDGYPGDIYLIK